MITKLIIKLVKFLIQRYPRWWHIVMVDKTIDKNASVEFWWNPKCTTACLYINGEPFNETKMVNEKGMREKKE